MSVIHRLFLVAIAWTQASALNVSEAFISHGVVPDILSRPPPLLLTVQFPDGYYTAEALGGNRLTVQDVATSPVINWGAEAGVYYTALTLDADVPTRANPSNRAFLHWLVINAQNNNVKTGNSVGSYLGPNPPAGSGPHRYVILVFRQPGRMSIDEVGFYNEQGRVDFSPEEFAARYNLGEPVAGNFYQVEN